MDLKEQPAKLLPMFARLEEVAIDRGLAVAWHGSGLVLPEERNAGLAFDEGDAFSRVLDVNSDLEVSADSRSQLSAIVRVTLGRDGI